jgi:hypothetical protein
MRGPRRLRISYCQRRHVSVGGERFWEILASSGQVGQIGHFSGGFWDEPFPQPRLGEAGFRFLVDSPWTDQRQERLTSPRQIR